MLKVKIVNGLMRGNYESSVDDRINSAIEALESEGLRVRDVKLFPLPYDRNLNHGAFLGYAVIYYDDSANYAETPEEIDDAYHRKALLESPRFSEIPFKDGEGTVDPLDDLACIETDENLEFIDKGACYDR